MTAPVFDLLARRALLTPDRLALREHVGGLHRTFAALDARAAAAAGALADLGIAPGDRVAVICRNRIAFFELLFGCAKRGAILAPLNWRMPPAELGPLLDDCGAAAVFTGAEDAETVVEAAAGRPVVNFDDSGPGGYEARLAAAPAQAREIWPAAEPWYLLYTSGTTGQPKGVIYTYGMAVANAYNVTQAIDLTSADRTLNFLPLFHTAGINLHTLPTLLAGGSAVILPGFEAEAVFDLVAARAVDTVFAVPAVYQELSLHPRFAAADLSAVRHWGCGGAPLPDALAAVFFARGVRVCNGMGMTETGPTVFIVDAENAARKIGSVGKPQLLAGVRIVDADGRDVADGETGEIWFAGPNVTPGYWGQPEATARAFACGGWLRSGDLGRRDAEGYVYIVGRLKEMFISGGENVYPAEIENALAAHPDILEAAVIGAPDPKWGEVGVAYVMPRPDRTAPDAEALRAFLRERLAGYKIPKRVVPVRDFPRTAAGKVRKHLLAADPPR